MIDIETGTYTIERVGAGAWGDDGRYHKGPKSEFEIKASIQPVTGNMVKLLPEHRRNTESVIIFSDERLFPSDEKNGKGADIVNYDGKKFEVFTVKKWAEFTDIPHYETIAIMVDGEGAKNE